MRRRLFNLLAAVSLVLCMATCVMWVQTRSDRDLILLSKHGERSSTFFTAVIADGHALLELNAFELASAPRLHGWQSSFRPSRGRLRVGFMVFKWESGTARRPEAVTKGGWQSVRYWKATVPFWPIAPLLAALPAGRLALWWRRDRHARGLALVGLCPACGYDLRATPERCLECGRVQSFA